LKRLFAPRSVAVVGASADPEKPGYQMLKMLAEFEGEVFPVNPRAETILGRRVYRTLSDIPHPVDLVAVVVPPGPSIDVLREAADTGAGAAMMVSGGFAETGEAGRALQDEVISVCRAGGVRLLGPNTSGFMAPSRKLFCTFMPGIGDLAPGGIAIVAQSGGINVSLTLQAHAEGLGLSLAVGLGNAPDIGLADVIEYLADDAETRAIIVHLEGVPDGRRLFEAIAKATANKPVVALPVGRADLGGFAESHTGNLIGRYGLTRAMLTQAGAVVVETSEEAIDAAHALSRVRLTPAPHPGVGILTGQAGPGLLMTDTLRHAGVSVPELAPDTIARIDELLPPMTFVRNPVDTGRPSRTFGAVMRAMADDPAIDALLVWALLEGDLIEPASLARDIRDGTGVPVVFGTASTPPILDPVLAALRAEGVPGFPSPDRAARAMRALAEDAKAAMRRRAELPSQPQPRRHPVAEGPLDEDLAKKLVESYGLATPARRAAATHDEALDAFRTIGGSVVVKLLDPGIAHKTEAGGVHLDIRTEDDLARALAAIDAVPGTRWRYLIEEMASDGVELIIGGTNDPSYGPTVLVGIGGTAAEAIGDTAVRLAPLHRAEAAGMLDELAGSVLLDGWRGAPPVDREAVIEAIIAVGTIVAAHPEIRELDLNPVRAYPEGVLVLDALAVL
jgi:acetyltransferase